MKIVHFSDGYLPRPGGIEHHVHDLAERQAADGHEVTVVTTTAGDAGGTNGVRLVRPSARSTATASEGFRHAWVRQALRRAPLAAADAVHIHMSSVSPLAMAAVTSGRLQGVPTVVTMHSMLAAARPLFAAFDTALGWRRSSVRWTAVSTAAARDLSAALGSGREVSVLPNGVDTAAWEGEHPRRDPGRLVVASAGRLAPRKRPRALLEIVAAARRRLRGRVSVEVVLAGDGPQRAGLQRYARRRGGGGWVRLAGSRSRAELREIYQHADLYLAPARLESFGLAALEARCAGLPVLGFGDSGVADFVLDGVDGALVDSDAAMTDALVALAGDSTRHQQLLARAGTVPPRFAWREVLPLTYAAYRAAAAAPARGDALSALP